MKFIGVQENRPDEDWKHHISGIISATKSGEFSSCQIPEFIEFEE